MTMVPFLFNNFSLKPEGRGRKTEDSSVCACGGDDRWFCLRQATCLTLVTPHRMRVVMSFGYLFSWFVVAGQFGVFTTFRLPDPAMLVYQS